MTRDGNLGMVPDTYQVLDPMRSSMRTIFYSWVTFEPDSNQDGYGCGYFFLSTGNPMGTRYCTTDMILGCEQVKMCSFYDINYDLL
jgi:hypothetical protein